MDGSKPNKTNSKPESKQEEMTEEKFEEDVDYTQPCCDHRCKICTQIIPGETSRKTYTCRSENIVYLITSPEGKNYIGITKAPMAKRMSQHRHAIRAGHGDGEKFTEYYRKESNFDDATITVLEEGNSEEDLRQKERKWIGKYDSLHNGLNSQR